VQLVGFSRLRFHGLKIILEYQLEYQYHSGNFINQESRFAQQALEGESVAGNVIVFRCPLAESKMQASHAAGASRIAHAAGI